MSAPSRNPDTRPLPEGWIEQWDNNYKQWFYVNTRESPPRSSWVHPSGPMSQTPQPSGFAPPGGGPPPNSPYGGGQDQQRGWNSSPNPQGYGGPPGGGYQGGPPQGGYQGYGGSPQPQQYGGYGGQPGGGYGGAPGGGYAPSYQQGPGYGGGYQNEDRGFFSHSSNSTPQPQPVYVQQAAPQKKSGGMGTALMAGGAGLVGGALLAEAFDGGDGGGDGGDGGDGGGDYGGGDDGGGDYGGGDDGGGDW